MAFSEHQRHAITDLVTQRYLEEMSTKDLEAFFCSVYSNMLEDYTDEALRIKLEEVATPEELADFAVVEEMRAGSPSDRTSPVCP